MGVERSGNLCRSKVIDLSVTLINSSLGLGRYWSVRRCIRCDLFVRSIDCPKCTGMRWLFMRWSGHVRRSNMVRSSWSPRVVLAWAFVVGR